MANRRMKLIVSEPVKDVIRSVRSLLSSSESYDPRWFAKDKHGNSLHWTDPDAVKFDLVGAIYKICEDNVELLNEVLNTIKLRLPKEFTRIHYYSEKLLHADLLVFLDSFLVEPADKLEEPPPVEDVNEAPPKPVKKSKGGHPRKHPVKNAE